jgi:DNA-binding MarR family transcriptional regulator
MENPHVLDTLASPARRAILEILCAAPQAASALAERAGLSLSASSQHLKQMLQAGLINASRDGKQRIYSVRPAGLALLQDYVRQLQATLSAARTGTGAGQAAAADDGRAMPEVPDQGQLHPVDRAAAYGRNWPGQDPAIYAISMRFLLLAAHVQRGLARTAAYLDLQGGELLVLDALFQVGAPYICTPTQLKQRMPISLAGISKRIDRLQAHGLVDRLIDPDDGRGTLVRMSKKAHDKMIGIMRQQRYGDDHAALMQMDASQRALLSSLLTDLLDLMDRVERSASVPRDEKIDK